MVEPMVKDSGMWKVFVCAFCLLAGCSRDLDKARACLAMGDYPLAIRFYGAAVEKEPLDYEARLGLGRALIQKFAAERDSGAFDYALVQLEACRSLRPSGEISILLSDAYTEQAHSLLARADTASALAALSKALECKSRSGPLNLAGIIYAKLGDADKAETLFKKALALDSVSASAHFNLGMIHWQRGEVSGAHAHWLMALKAMPEDEDVLYWFALSEKRLREIR